ncbi:protein-L-isoaspartate O-methyltransferase [soil metagenome]
MTSLPDSAEFHAKRHAMVASQLRTNAVSDARVVAAMARVPRETFAPAEARDLAYRDTAVPLGRGRSMNVPIATGRLLTEAAIMAGDKVLLIGAASGYTAAVLGELAASVVAVEEDADLAGIARDALTPWPNVELVEGPLTQGHAAGVPYDVLVIDGAVERVPAEILAQLRVGAHVATGLADHGVTRLASGRKSAGGFGLFDFADVDCVELPGFAAAKSFTF